MYDVRFMCMNIDPNKTIDMKVTGDELSSTLKHRILFEKWPFDESTHPHNEVFGIRIFLNGIELLDDAPLSVTPFERLKTDGIVTFHMAVRENSIGSKHESAETPQNTCVQYNSPSSGSVGISKVGSCACTIM